MDDVYRKAASVMLLRPKQEEGGVSYECLLLHKPRRSDAWQLPQGGVEEGEEVEQAAVRELAEEAGVRDIQILGPSSRVYQYDFPASFRRFRPDNVCGQRIEYVVALAPSDVVIHVDGQEIDGFIWATPDTFPQYIRRSEYLSIVQDLFEEALSMCGQVPHH